MAWNSAQLPCHRSNPTDMIQPNQTNNPTLLLSPTRCNSSHNPSRRKSLSQDMVVGMLARGQGGWAHEEQGQHTGSFSLGEGWPRSGGDPGPHCCSCLPGGGHSSAHLIYMPASQLRLAVLWKSSTPERRTSEPRSHKE